MSDLTIREMLRSDELSHRTSEAKKTKHDPPTSIRRNTAQDDMAIHIPPHMSSSDALKWVTRWDEDERKFVDVNMYIDGLPIDAAHALLATVKAQFGVTDLRSTPGFFGDRAPTFITVPTHDGGTVEVYIGRMGLPGFDEKSFIETAPDGSQGTLRLAVHGSVRRKEMPLLEKLLNETRRYLAANSLYKGHAIEFSPKDADEDNSLLLPTFFSTAAAERPILNHPLSRQIYANVELPLMQRECVGALGIPFKQGVVFSGKGGTGKSMMAAWLAKICEENGITFIYQKNVNEIVAGYELAAKRFAPALLFVEDCERAFEDEKQAKNVQIVLDGVNNKQDEVMVVFTTNYEEKIPALAWRHGRINLYAYFDAPDSHTVSQLIRRYAGERLAPNTNLEAVAAMMAGKIPSTIREMVERAIKLGVAEFALSHNNRMPNPEEVQITSKDLIDAAVALKRHIELIEARPAAALSAVEKFGVAIGAMQGAALIEAVKTLATGEAMVSSATQLEEAHIRKITASVNGTHSGAALID